MEPVNGSNEDELRDRGACKVNGGVQIKRNDDDQIRSDHVKSDNDVMMLRQQKWC